MHLYIPHKRALVYIFKACYSMRIESGHDLSCIFKNCKFCKNLYINLKNIQIFKKQSMHVIEIETTFKEMSGYNKIFQQ